MDIEKKTEVKKKKKVTLHGIIIIIAILCIIIGAGGFIGYHLENAHQQKMYEDLADLVRQPYNPEDYGTAVASEKSKAEANPLQASVDETEENAETELETYVSPINFPYLKELNPDVVGWITIPGTTVDYPIVQGPDNDYYLRRNVYGEDATVGSIYLDCDNKPDFSSQHNIIYGHHMRNGTMFKDIDNFTDQTYFNNHRDIIIYTPTREIHLRTLAAALWNSSAFFRRNSFYSDDDFAEYIEYVTSNSQAIAEPESKITRLYSLVTCSYDYNDERTILYAYEIDDKVTDK